MKATNHLGHLVDNELEHYIGDLESLVNRKHPSTVEPYRADGQSPPKLIP